jgi:hypothetical protein
MVKYPFLLNESKLYVAPPAPFEMGDKVWLEGKRHEVLFSTHTHSQLQGLEKAVANWRLSKRKLRKQ